MKTYGNISVIRPEDRDIAQHILTHDLPQRSIAEKYRRNIKVPIRISGEIKGIVREGFDSMLKRIGCGKGLDLELILKAIELKLGTRLTEKLITEMLELHSRKLKRRKFHLRCGSGKEQVFEIRKRQA